MSRVANSPETAIRRNQTWLRRKDSVPFKVMAVVDGYVMCRRPSAIPTLFSVREFMQDFDHQPKEGQ